MNLKRMMALLAMGSLQLMDQKQYQLESPDTKLKAVVTVDDDLTFS